MERLGKYRLLESVGAGAMGEVWLAEHETLRIHHALKLLPRALASSSDFRARFEEEGRVLALLRHPGIVPVHDMGHEGDTFYIAMDFVSPDGRVSQSLGRRLRSSAARRLDGAEAAHVLAQVLAAVEHAHSRGVIHRDIKPDNILLDHGGAVRVSDFGLASVVGADFLRSSIAASLSGSMGAQPTGFVPQPGDGSSDTSQMGIAATVNKPGSSAAASLVGTYSYMPPEVRAGGEWSVAGDIYSLGVVAYQMVVGRLPEGRWKNPTALVPGLPDWWDMLVERALEADECDRWETVSDMRGAMEIGRAHV